MPLVSIRYSHAVAQQTIKAIVPVLCETVANQLSYTDDDGSFEITPAMVKIRFSVMSPLDVHMPDLYIEVEARAFKSRMTHAEQYAAGLGQAIAPLLPKDVHASVWFKLCHAGWYSGTSA